MAQTSSQQIRAFQGPALFSYGFRPFFLFGALWAAVAMIYWVAALSGSVEPLSRFDPISWHAHEFLFGYVSAILAGFVLTAVPNWTGRLPIVGWPLAGLFALWAAGRVTMFISAMGPVILTSMVDTSFLVVLGAVILREIIAGKNWRNLIILALVAVLTLANITFHIEAARGESASQGYGLRLGLGTVITMIAVVGGRIIPSFTRNWLARNNRTARPAPPMQTFDKITLLASVGTLLCWVIAPDHTAVGTLLGTFSVLHLARLVRWQGHHTVSDPLVWILHAAYALIPLGGFMLAAYILFGAAGSAAAQHIWMAGAIGAMTLAVMTRATLGHTGQALAASTTTVAIYVCLFASVAARAVSGSLPQFITLSGLLWIAAFGGFAICYGPALLRSQKEKLA